MHLSKTLPCFRVDGADILSNKIDRSVVIVDVAYTWCICDASDQASTHSLAQMLFLLGSNFKSPKKLFMIGKTSWQLSVAC